MKKQNRFKKPPLGPPHMEDGVCYDLTTPANIKGKIFHRVQCEYRVPAHPDEYVVKGIPEGGEKVESFVLIFSGKGRVVTRKSENQEGF